MKFKHKLKKEGVVYYPVPFPNGIDTFIDDYLSFGWLGNNPQKLTSQNAFWYLYRRFGASESAFDEYRELGSYLFFPKNNNILIRIKLNALDCSVFPLGTENFVNNVFSEWKEYEKNLSVGQGIFAKDNLSFEQNKQKAFRFIHYFEQNQKDYPLIWEVFRTCFAFEKFMRETVYVRDVDFDLWGSLGFNEKPKKPVISEYQKFKKQEFPKF